MSAPGASEPASPPEGKSQSLAEISIRRPVLAIVFSIVLVIFGAVAFFLLSVREYPAVDPPIVTVTTNYTGASPDVIDAQITEPIEQALSGISGIRTMSSTSREQTSVVRLEFDLAVNIEAAANDVRDKVSGVVRRLPTDADPPIVEKADADSDPIVFLTVRSDAHDILEVNNVADTLIKERVQTIPGVSTVRIFGEKRYAMRLWLSADKMAAHKVTPGDVQRALAGANVELPSGRVEGKYTELAVNTKGRLLTPAEFDQIPIRSEGARTIRLEDVGRAELGPLNTRGSLKEGGQSMIGVAIIPQPNTNAIAIADEFYRRLEQIKKEIPPEYHLEIGYDFTKYVRRSVAEVEETLIVAFALVAVIIFLFLRSFRSTVIPLIAIPVSIVASFALLYLFGYSINVLTMVGIVLSIGLVCDDAIVVLENIYSKIEHGMKPLDAAIAGSREIYFAIISTTITLAVVFLPIVFIQGLTGKLFREFAVVVVGSVLISGFVALTLSPMMCRFLLKADGSNEGWFYRVTEPFFVGMTNVYAKTLAVFMKIRVVALPMIVAVFGLSYWLFTHLPTELAPLEDRANIRVNVRAPEGATYAYMDRELNALSEFVLEEVPATELWRTYSIVGAGGQGVNVGVQNIYLKDGTERERTQEEIFQAISKKLGRFSNVRISPAQPPTIGARNSGLPVQVVLQARNLNELVEALPGYMEAAQKRPEVRFVDVDLKVNRPELNLKLNRERAAELNVTPEEIARTLQLSLGGVRYGYFVMNGRQYEVIGQLEENDRDEPQDLARLFVRSSDGLMIPSDAVILGEESASAGALYRYDRYVSATVSASPAAGYTLGDGIKALQDVAKETLPPSFRTDLAGQSRDFSDSSSSTAIAFVFALVLIYLVLAAQFESFIDPIVILVTVPLSLAGALLGLWLTKQSLNVFSQIGMIMLVGLVTKNGILVVEFANQKRAHGLSAFDAATEASVARLRPILMTTLATLLGILPIALSLGGAAGSRRSLGIAVVGGLLVSGLLTLYLVPAVYTLFARKKPGGGETQTAQPAQDPTPAPAAPP